MGAASVRRLTDVYLNWLVFSLCLVRIYSCIRLPFLYLQLLADSLLHALRSAIGNGIIYCRLNVKINFKKTSDFESPLFVRLQHAITELIYKLSTNFIFGSGTWSAYLVLGDVLVLLVKATASKKTTSYVRRFKSDRDEIWQECSYSEYASIDGVCFSIWLNNYVDRHDVISCRQVAATSIRAGRWCRLANENNTRGLPVPGNVISRIWYLVHSTPFLKKLCQYYFLNNSVKHWPTLIIFGTQHREETRRSCPPHLNNVAALPCEMQKS